VLVPTQVEDRIKTLNLIFEWWVHESIPMNRIATRLNDLGKYHTHGPWYAVLLRGVLETPAAIGRPSWNKRASGLYAELVHGHRISTDPPRKSPNEPKTARRRARSEWIGPERELYPPLVPVGLYERAQVKLASMAKTARAPRSETLWLAGLLYCAKCKAPMVGWYYKNDRGCPTLYACSTYRKLGHHNPHGCKHHRIASTKIEKILDEYLEEVAEDIKAVESLELACLLSLKGEKLKRLHGVVSEMESYLLKHLEVADYKMLGDVRVYEMGGVRLELPGASEAELRWTFNWLYEYRSQHLQVRRSELAVKLRGLYEKWDQLTGLPRQWCQEEMERVESELAAISKPVNLSEQYQEAIRELTRTALGVSRARMASGLRNKAEAVRKLLEGLSVRSRTTRLAPRPVRGWFR